MSLDQLPPELLQQIATELPRQTLSRLSQVSTRYNAIATPLLQDDALLLSANGRTLRPQAGDVASSVRRAASVTVASPVPSDTVSGSVRARCPGCDLADSGREAETGEALIRDVLAGCEPGRLRKFTWLLGICIQPDILGPAGLLATTQPNLQELRLSTCYHRLGLRCQTRSLDLSPFINLRALSWTGIHLSQFRLAARALSSAARRLEDLELDYLSSTISRDALPADNLDESSYFPALILGMQIGAEDAVFPRLKRLSLTNVDLWTLRWDELYHALNMPRLESLSLKQCQRYTALLRSAIALSPPDGLPLRSLELHTSREHDEEGSVHLAVEQLLPCCPELRELRAYRANGASRGHVDGERPALDFRLPGLRRVVLHDVPPMGALDVRRWWAGDEVGVPGVVDTRRGPLSYSPALEVLGCAGRPEQVKMLLDQLTHPAALANLRVLHLRHDHEETPRHYSPSLGEARPDPSAAGLDPRRILTPEAHALASWALHSPKLPSLSLLAIGDFGSLDPRFRILLRRSDTPDDIRVVDEHDVDIADLLAEHVDALVAGPTYARPYLRESGASLAASVWGPGLADRLVRESGERAPTVPVQAAGPVTEL